MAAMFAARFRSITGPAPRFGGLHRLEVAMHQPLVASLRTALDARATGLWGVEGDRLAIWAFDRAPDMPEGVARRFVEAAASVRLDRRELGVVNAVVERSVAVSLAGRLPIESGSGYWLRSFGAERSVAVPLTNAEGEIVAVLSAALADLGPPDDEEVARIIRAHGATLTGG